MDLNRQLGGNGNIICLCMCENAGFCRHFRRRKPGENDEALPIHLFEPLMLFLVPTWEVNLTPVLATSRAI